MNVKDILYANGFRFDKKLGQNFLTDEKLLDDIVGDANIASCDTVLEIGAGAGTLTRRLALKANKVVAYEIDKRLEKVLYSVLAGTDNTEIIFGDFMQADLSYVEKLLRGKYKVVANIPYYITTPLIMKFVDESINAESLTLTVQKEVAERLCATSGNKDYGAVTAVVGAVANAAVTRYVERGKFVPSPDVDSAVVNIVFDRDKFHISDIDFYRRTVKCAFAMRRKTLANNMVSAFNLSREKAEKILAECRLEKNVRGETLSVNKFVELSDILKKEITSCGGSTE